MKVIKGVKPCPFCGNKKLRMYTIMSASRTVTIGYKVLCEPDNDSCGAEGPIFETKLKAKKAWNRRSRKS